MVVDAPDPVVAFAEYTQQQLGVPWPTQQDLRILRKKVKEFLEHYPKLSIRTLCRVVEWAKSRRRRYDRVWKVVDAFRYAWVDGVLPELAPNQAEAPVEERIKTALAVETSAWWRRALIGAQGTQTRRSVIDQWEAERRGAH